MRKKKFAKGTDFFLGAKYTCAYARKRERIFCRSLFPCAFYRICGFSRYSICDYLRFFSAIFIRLCGFFNRYGFLVRFSIRLRGFLVRFLCACAAFNCYGFLVRFFIRLRGFLVRFFIRLRGFLVRCLFAWAAFLTARPTVIAPLPNPVRTPYKVAA